jgi:hypothetical protein
VVGQAVQPPVRGADAQVGGARGGKHEDAVAILTGRRRAVAPAGQVGQAVEALEAEAAAPIGNRVWMTGELRGDLVVSRLIGRGTAQRQAGAEGQGLLR